MVLLVRRQMYIKTHLFDNKIFVCEGFFCKIGIIENCPVRRTIWHNIKIHFRRFLLAFYPRTNSSGIVVKRISQVVVEQRYDQRSRSKEQSFNIIVLKQETTDDTAQEEKYDNYQSESDASRQFLRFGYLLIEKKL